MKMLCVIYNDSHYIGTKFSIVNELFTYHFTENFKLKYKLKYCYENESTISWSDEFSESELNNEAIEYLFKVLKNNGAQIFIEK